MSNLDVKITMLETLYDLTDKGNLKGVYQLSEYSINILDDIKQSNEQLAYATAIDTILLAANSFEVSDLSRAKEEVNAYKKIMNWL